MLDTFTGDFLSRAFPFVYKSQLGQPDSRSNESLRQRHGGPRVDTYHHVNCMNRRIEQQYKGDWAHNYTLWNVSFREKLNQSRMFYAVATGHDEPGVEVSPSTLTRACQEITQALKGSYVTPEGKKMPVKGDVSKLLYATGISPLARRLLYNVQGMTQDMAGTHQSKRRARSITNSVRVQHGISYFITLSPAENQNAIIMRCVRLRASDPFLIHNPHLARWYKRTEPAITDCDAKETEDIPDFETRRRILTNSAISCVDGFKAHTTLLFKFIFGLKICPRCPFCTCRDAEGKSNEVEGGCAGRMLSLVGTFEFQKKG